MELRDAKLKMISGVPGSWGVVAGCLGMTVNALRNRAYEVKGQVLTEDHCLALQALSGTTYYAEAIATASGGVFVKLPDDLSCENEVLMKKFNDLYTELGTFSRDFSAATADEKIDQREREILEEDAARMHKVLSELVALMFRIYTPQAPAARPEGA
jgi:hypothetical protein